MNVWHARTTSFCVLSLKSGGLHTAWWRFQFWLSLPHWLCCTRYQGVCSILYYDMNNRQLMVIANCFFHADRCKKCIVTALIWRKSLPEPGIHRGNEDSRGNENQKLQNKIFSVGKKTTSILFLLWKLRWWMCEYKLKVENWISLWILVC